MTRPSLATNVHPRLPRYGRLTHEQERLGVTVALQAEPWEGARFTVDVLHARLQATRQEDFLEAISFSRTAAQGGKPQTSVVQAEYDPNGNLLYGVFNGVDIRSESRFDELDTNVLAISAAVGPGGHRPAPLLLARRPLDLASSATRSRPRRRSMRPTSTATRSTSATAAASRPSPIRSTSTSTTGPLRHHRHAAGRHAGATSRRRKSASARRAPTTASPPSAATSPGIWCPTGSTLKAGGFYREYDFSTFEFRRVNQNDTILALPAGTPLARSRPCSPASAAASASAARRRAG